MIDLSIRRPVLTTMLMAALAVLGLVALLKTPRTLIPSLKMPYVTVTVAYPGAGPEEIESRVTKPIEDAVAGIEGLKHIYSRSMSNVSVIICEFEVGTDPDRAASDVREKVASVRGRLPEGVREPVVQKIDIRASPVLQLALYGGLSDRELRELADDVIKPRLARVEGVGAVDVFGGLEREIEVEVDKDRLWAYGLSLDQFISLLRAQSLKVPAGQVKAGPREYGIRTVGEFASVEQIREAEIPLPTGGSVKVSDLARVYDGAKEPDFIGRYNGKRAVIIQVVKRPEASAVKVADGVRRELRRLRPLLPASVHLDIAVDMSEHEREAFRVNLSTLVGGILLAALVLLVFLGSLRVTLIASTVMPAAAIAALFPVFLSGFTLNILSLGGIALTIGTLAALSIVILESIETQRLGGLPLHQAASVGTKRVAVPTVASALTNIVIFLPIAFAGGLVGMFLKELGLSVTYATLMALLFCFTLMPMMAAHVPVLGGAKGKAREPLASRLTRRWAESAARLASWALRHRALTILLAVLVFLPAIPVKRKFVGTEFMPRTDIGKFCITVEAPEGASLQETEKVVERIERAVMRQPEVVNVVSVVGRVTELFGVRMGHNLAMITVSLKPLKERKRSQRGVMMAVEPEVTRVPGARKVRIFEYSYMGEMNVPLEVDILSLDLALAASASREVYDVVRRLSGARFVDTSWKPGPPELRLVPDRERCADSGVTVAQVAMLLRSAVEGDTTMKFRRHGKEYDVRIRLEKEDRDSVEDLVDVPVSPMAGGGLMAAASSMSPSGGPEAGMMGAGGFVPPLLRLGDLCKVEFGRAPTSIDRKDRLYMVGISGDSEVPLGELTAKVRKAVGKLRLPKGVEVAAGRMTEMMEEAFGTLVMSFAIAVVLTFITLAAIVESYSMPLSMMLTIPLAYAGGIYLLALLRMPFAITSMMAMIMLVGLVVNNAVLVLDAAAQRRKEGMPREEAMSEGVRERFRPVVMATLSVIAGMLPTALAKSGVGAMRAPMAVAIIGGMVLSTVLVFFVIPAVQTVLEDLAPFFLSALKFITRKSPREA